MWRNGGRSHRTSLAATHVHGDAQKDSTPTPAEPTDILVKSEGSSLHGLPGFLASIESRTTVLWRRGIRNPGSDNDQDAPEFLTQPQYATTCQGR